VSYDSDGRLCLPDSFEKEAEEFGHEVHQWPAIPYGKSADGGAQYQSRR